MKRLAFISSPATGNDCFLSSLPAHFSSQINIILNIRKMPVSVILHYSCLSGICAFMIVLPPDLLSGIYCLLFEHNPFAHCKASKIAKSSAVCTDRQSVVLLLIAITSQHENDRSCKFSSQIFWSSFHIQFKWPNHRAPCCSSPIHTNTYTHKYKERERAVKDTITWTPGNNNQSQLVYEGTCYLRNKIFKEMWKTVFFMTCFMSKIKVQAAEGNLRHLRKKCAA